MSINFIHKKSSESDWEKGERKAGLAEPGKQQAGDRAYLNFESGDFDFIDKTLKRLQKENPRLRISHVYAMQSKGEVTFGKGTVMFRFREDTE